MITMSGAASRRFVTSYGFFVKPGVYNNTAVVVCTTCHNPHSMNVVTVNQQFEFRTAGGNLRDHVLPARSVQSERHQSAVEPDGAILPSVSRGQIKRNEWQHRRYNVLAEPGLSS